MTDASTKYQDKKRKDRFQADLYAFTAALLLRAPECQNESDRYDSQRPRQLDCHRFIQRRGSQAKHRVPVEAAAVTEEVSLTAVPAKIPKASASWLNPRI